MTKFNANIKGFQQKNRTFTNLAFATFSLSLFIASSAGCRQQQALTEQERTQIAKFIPELELEKKKIHKQIEHRRSTGRLHYTTGTRRFETWSQRYSSNLTYYDSIIRAFKMELENGTKVVAPARFRNSMGYHKSKYKRYFIH